MTWGLSRRDNFSELAWAEIRALTPLPSALFTHSVRPSPLEI